MKNYYKEAIAEHNENAESIEYHTKESVVALYLDLLKIMNALVEEETE